MKKRIIISVGFFVLLVSASVGILYKYNNKGENLKELSGNILIVVGLSNNSSQSAINEIQIHVSAKSLIQPYNVRINNATKSFSKKISNLPIDEEISVVVKAYDKKRNEITKGEQKLELGDSNLAIAEFVLADKE